MIPLQGIYPKELTSRSLRDINIPLFMAVLFTISRMWNHPKYPSADKWIKMVRIYNGM